MSNKEIAEVINLTEERFKSVAPPAISYEAEKGFAMQILMNNPYLMKVAEENNASLAQAITNVAAIGLSLNPAEKQAYLIPRNVKIGNQWISKIFLEPSYMGLCKLATDSGAIEWVQANCVYGHDTFTDNGPGERPTHTYNAFSKDRGEFAGVYCIAKTASGDYLTTIMTAEEVSGIMERSESYKAFKAKKVKSCVWTTDFGQMAKKTAVRRAFNMWPRSVGGERLAEAVHISNENEGFEPLVTAPEITQFTAEQKAYYDQLIENSQSLEMYVLSRTIEAGVWGNLYNSFERGSIGRYKKIIDDLHEKGKSQFMDYVNSINSIEGDDYALKEMFAELPDDALELMERHINDDALTVLREYRKEA